MAKLKEHNSLVLKLDADALQLHYQPSSEDAIFDICDQNGKIWLSGMIDGNPTICDLRNVAKGKYFVYVIDSGKIHRDSLRID